MRACYELTCADEIRVNLPSGQRKQVQTLQLVKSELLIHLLASETSLSTLTPADEIRVSFLWSVKRVREKSLLMSEII